MEALGVLLLFLAYLLGALPVGYWLAKRLSGVDPLKASTYNLGLESALRKLGGKALFAAFVADFLKGYLAVYLISGFGPPWTFAAALLAYLGHLYPFAFLAPRMPLRARGAGVLFGALAGLSVGGLGTLYALVPVALALVAYAATGYATLAALTLALTLALVASFLPLDPLSKALAWALFLLALWRYKENLGRILEGTEPKLGEPLPLPDERTVVCAFMIHPLTIEDLWQSPRFRWLRPLVERGLVPKAWIERLAERFRPMKVGEIRGVRTADGREIRCHLMGPRSSGSGPSGAWSARRARGSRKPSPRSR